jgi:hypothetical protein
MTLRALLAAVFAPGRKQFLARRAQITSWCAHCGERYWQQDGGIWYCGLCGAPPP